MISGAPPAGSIVPVPASASAAASASSRPTPQTQTLPPDAPRPRSALILPSPPPPRMPRPGGGVPDSRRPVGDFWDLGPGGGADRAPPSPSSSPSSSPSPPSPPPPPMRPSPPEWNVTDVSLRPVPPFFPLERTRAVLTGDELPVGAVACRIARRLGDVGASASYDDAGAAAMVSTDDGDCRFRIRFFRGGGGGGRTEEPKEEEEEDGGGSVLLELQRRRGSCVAFRAAAREVLRAARGLAPAPPATEGRGGRPPFRPAGGERTTEEGATGGEADDDAAAALADADAALGTVRRLLGSDRIDAGLLGMECLRCLTDPSSAGNSRVAAEAAARAILCGGGGGDDDDKEDGREGGSIGDAVARLVARRRPRAASAKDEEDDYDYDDYDYDDDYDEPDAEDVFVGAMRSHALTALANSLETLGGTTTATKSGGGGAAEGSVGSSDRTRGDGGPRLGTTTTAAAAAAEGLVPLLPLLLDDVIRLSSSRPRDASEAARCLNAAMMRDRPSSEDDDGGGGRGGGAARRGAVSTALGARRGGRAGYLREVSGVVCRHPRLARQLDVLREGLGGRRRRAAEEGYANCGEGGAREGEAARHPPTRIRLC